MQNEFSPSSTSSPRLSTSPIDTPDEFDIGSSSLLRLHPARIALAVLFAAIMLFTRPVNIGSDAFWYVSDIRGTIGHPWTDSAAIWDFAHLLWRPLGRVLAAGLLPLVGPLVGGDEQAGITLLLIALNVIAAFVCCFLVQSTIWRLTGKPWIATLIAAAFLGFNPLLNDSRVGSPYVAALAFSMAALYLVMFSTSAYTRTAVTAGLLSALAAALWVPFLVSLPAVLLARPVLRYRSGGRLDFRFPAMIVLVCGATLAVFYGLVLYADHIGTFHDFRAWMVHSAAGVNDVRDQTLVRMATGMVRGIYNLGQDSVWFKWYLFHDPYARVSLPELFQASLARIVLFYCTLAGLIVFLFPSGLGKRLLLLLLILAGPHIGMALAFESGAPERYIAPLGLVAIAFGYIAGNAHFGRAKRILGAVLCCLPIAFNIAAANSANTVEHDVERITPLLHVPAASRVFVVNLRDSLFTFRYSAPFHPIQRENLPRIDAIQPYGRSLWRTDFACAALSAWQDGGQVWITNRVLSEAPLRAWLWVEGDNKSISWAAVNRFFTSLNRGERVGAEDGFSRLEDTTQNRVALLSDETGGHIVCSQ